MCGSRRTLVAKQGPEKRATGNSPPPLAASGSTYDGPTAGRAVVTPSWERTPLVDINHRGTGPPRLTPGSSDVISDSRESKYLHNIQPVRCTPGPVQKLGAVYLQSQRRFGAVTLKY
jgi:hypothetical protein